MKRFIFGGTSEGRAMCEKYLAAGDQVAVCVTSEYAKALVPPGATVHAQAMDAAQMIDAVRAFAPDELIDATHPYAEKARENIRACAEATGVSLTRIERAGAREGGEGALGAGEGKIGAADGITWARDAGEAARALSDTRGNILLTTGSHTAEVYLSALDPARVYLRVLPTASVMQKMEALGVLPGHLIAMQGPFSEALNGALYDQFSIRHVVSKDSGVPGGVPEKLAAARARGIHFIMIARPAEIGQAAREGQRLSEQ
ncbi:MAG: precorrin-6A reductase [Clostridia bacterium]